MGSGEQNFGIKLCGKHFYPEPSYHPYLSISLKTRDPSSLRSTFLIGHCQRIIPQGPGLGFE